MTEFVYAGYTITEGRETETHSYNIRSRDHKRIRLIRHIDAKPDDPSQEGATNGYIVGVRRPDESPRMFSESAIEASRQHGWAMLVYFIRLRARGMLG